MDKGRLELFSDGVFVIVLTLLVLDLKPPAHGGLTGLGEIAPGLAVHALTFAVVGSQWLSHHNSWTRIYEINTRTLALNLLALFFVTLIPFGARIAAETPSDGLGIGLVCACRAFFGIANMAAAMSAPVARHTNDPAALAAVVRVRWIVFGLIATHLVAAGLCVFSPWFGYGVLPLGFLYRFVPAVRRLDLPASARASETGAADMAPGG